MKPLDTFITTVVVQNLPGRYTQQDVLKAWPVDGSYDFMHVPYNLLQKRPLGYIFINFLTHELAVAFQQKWHGKVLPSSGHKKPLDVGPAEVQGRFANLVLIKSRKMGQLEKVGFLPLLFKDGRMMDSKAILAELSELRNHRKAVRSRETAQDKKSQTEAVCSHAAPGPTAPQQEKCDVAGDADSDAPTTATGTEVSFYDQEWAGDVSQDESVSSQEASRLAMSPMYISLR